MSTDLKRLTVEVWTPEYVDKDGGIQSHTRDLTHTLSELISGKEPRVVSYADSINQITKLWNQILFFVRACRSLWKPADLIMITHVDLAPVAALLNRIRPIRYTVSCHGIELWRKLPDRKAGALKQADALLCVSRYTQSRIISEQKLDSSRAILFPNTTYFPDDLPDKKSMRSNLVEKYGIPTDDHIIFTLGRMRPSDRDKGYGYLWKSVAIMNRAGTSTTLIAAGGGPDTEWLMEQATSDRHPGKLICPGRIESKDMALHFQGCDIFAMPSTKEGFGIVFLEALAHGTPVLAGNADGSTEPTQNGECGLLCNPHNPSEIAETLTQFLTTPDHPLKNSNELRLKSKKKFGKEPYRDLLAEILTHIVKK